MKNLMQSMLAVAREGTIAMVASVAMLSASIAVAAPPRPAPVPRPGSANVGGDRGPSTQPIPKDAPQTWEDKLLGGIVKATLWTVGAPFPENLTKTQRMVRYGAAIGLAAAGGVAAVAALTVTAPVWVTAVGVIGGAALIVGGMHLGFGALFGKKLASNNGAGSNPNEPGSRPSDSGTSTIPTLPGSTNTNPPIGTGSGSTTTPIGGGGSGTPGTNVGRTGGSGILVPGMHVPRPNTNGAGVHH